MAVLVRAIFFALIVAVVGGLGYPRICIPDTTPLIKGFRKLDVTKLTGIWYSFLWRRNPMVPDDRVLSEYTAYVTAGKDGAFSFHIRALPKDGQKCTDINEASSLVPTGNPGDFSFGPSESNNHFKIIDTDYTNYLLVLRCYGEDKQGRCQRDAIQLWSRRVGLDPIYVYSGMKNIAQRLCKTFEGFRFSVHKLACQLRE
ncbi:uncharacterized protein LOC106166357 [Lingula anatina]|uniref:Uncharacterized protein LOC106166357 n=1 Tax=Lingula anatina TaxID=7574 RepID=A0A1S3IR01_LINAN|nr:uncharacterized protein LOC106166357 [Lingula anatina]|eukprot:XP_013400346.1 uncharacterized protein LOC106166357 [Lingula anatina]